MFELTCCGHCRSSVKGWCIQWCVGMYSYDTLWWGVFIWIHIRMHTATQWLQHTATQCIHIMMRCCIRRCKDLCRTRCNYTFIWIIHMLWIIMYYIHNTIVYHVMQTALNKRHKTLLYSMTPRHTVLLMYYTIHYTILHDASQWALNKQHHTLLYSPTPRHTKSLIHYTLLMYYTTYFIILHYVLQWALNRRHETLLCSMMLRDARIRSYSTSHILSFADVLHWILYNSTLCIAVGAEQAAPNIVVLHDAKTRGFASGAWRASHRVL